MLKNQPKKRKTSDSDNGFEKWGGYMNAKISKLEAQFDADELSIVQKEDRVSDIFKGIAIFVNGYTEPSADELRCLMLQHGGIYHHYYRSGKTTHIIASALPNAKFDHMKHLKVVKCDWITESIQARKLLDYKKFLLQNDFPNALKGDNILMKFSRIESASNNKNEIELPKTAADDGYLTEFYKNSRLHYISALGAMLKQYVQELREKHNGDFPSRKHLLNVQDAQLDQENFLEGTLIMHIDLDCFFVSVALKNYPDLKGQPVAVTHARGNSSFHHQNTDRKFEYEFYKKKMKSKLQSEEKESSESEEESVEEWSNEKSSMSEIASCSYEARKAGVRKGMYLGVALKLCPNLKTVPYDFEGYKEVSLTLYNTVAEYTLDIEAISCDELFIDCTNLIEELKINPLKFSEVLRQEILEKTSCTSSVGIGSNKLQARLATKHAKPNGQFYLTADQVEEFMKKLEVWDLPGVGRTLSSKLKLLNIKTCEELQKLPLSTLKKEFGGKTGETLFKYCRGDDDRKVNFSHERKSVSAEVNYGIRFNDNEETETFLKQLSEEVSKRLKDLKMMGKNITFKVMFRAKDAPVETAKFLGHGACDQINRSVGLPSASNDGSIIAKHVIGLYHQLSIPPNELRGIGIQVTKLEPIKKNSKTLQTYFAAEKSNETKKPVTATTVQPSSANNFSVQLPTASEIDLEVLASLPEDIRLEVLQEYGLMNLAKESKSENYENNSKNACSSSDSDKYLGNFQTSDSDMEKLKEGKTNDTIEKFFNLSLKEMRIMIKEWVAVEEEPKSCDVNMLKSYFSRLVEKKKLEDITILINCLYRHINTQQKDSEVWKKTYDNIFMGLQTSMLNTFGKKLHVV